MEKTRLDLKLDIIIKKFPEIKKVFNRHLILSFTNGIEKAVTLKFKASSFSNVVKDIKKAMNPVILSSNYDIKWLKIDILKDVDDEDLDYVFSNITKFIIKSYFCDEKDNPYEIYTEGINIGRRIIDKLSYDEVKSIIKNSSNFLFNMLGDDGKFIYALSPLEDSESDDYNVVRHAGSMWSLIESFDKDDYDAPEKKEKIIKGLKYLKKYIVKKNKDIYYVTNMKGNTISLGTLALYVVALVTYTNKFNDNQFKSLIKKLCNGIISLQEEDGSFIHIINTQDFSIKKKYSIVYYDGESTLALLNAYGLLNDEEYINSVRKAVRFFIDKNYIQYHDHWISYTMNYLSNYDDNKEFMEFGLKNVFCNYLVIKNRLSTSHTNFEMIMQCFELFKKYNLECSHEIEGYTIDNLKELIIDKSLHQLNSYLYPEIAMYLSNPAKYVYTFSIKTDNYRIRIDDIQHSLMGYIVFLKNYDEINK